jgi:hypothetical protein
LPTSSSPFSIFYMFFSKHHHQQASPQTYLQIQAPKIQFIQLHCTSIGCPRSTLCQRPLHHQTFLEYLVLASFHPQNIPRIPCAGVLPSNGRSWNTLCRRPSSKASCCSKIYRKKENLGQ